MAGWFELVDAPDGGYRLRMLDKEGKLMAVTVTFPTKRAAMAGVAQTREIAGTGLVKDRSIDGRPAAAQFPRTTRRTAAGGGRAASLAGGPPAAGKRARAHR